jgi:hypothetical protein
MLSYDLIRKGHIGVIKDDQDIILEFKDLVTPNGIETYKNKNVINLDLKDTNEGYNLKIELQHLEHQIIKNDKIEEIDFTNYKFIPVIKLERFLRINIPNDVFIQAKTNDKISGKIKISKIWYFGNSYGLYCHLIQ